MQASRSGNMTRPSISADNGITEPDGDNFFDDTVASNDLAFRIGIELGAEVCGFADNGTETGQHEVVVVQRRRYTPGMDFR